MDGISMLVGLAAGSAVGFALAWSLRGGRTSSGQGLEQELRAQLGQTRQELQQLGEQRLTAESERAKAVAGREAEVREREALARQSGESARDLRELQERLLKAQSEQAAELAGRKSAEAQLLEQRRLHEEQQRQLREDQQRLVLDLREAFRALSAEALKQTQPEFLRLANETLAKFNEAAKGDLAQRQEAIAGLVKPLEEQLRTYQQRLAQSETQQAAVLGEVTKHLTSLAEQSGQLSSETQRLRRILSSNQARGRWGEETLRRVVEVSGLSPHCDFTEQAQSEDKKPDLLVHLPGGRVIIVDAKVPDLQGLEAAQTADETKRAVLLDEHAKSLRQTIKALADRSYPEQFAGSLDFVVLFVPAESLLSLAVERDREMIIWAAERRVLLATPASLIALLRAVGLTWQQQAQILNARQIAEEAATLYQRVVTFVEHFDSIGAHLGKAAGAYNKAVGSYTRMVRPQGEKILALGVATGGKALPEAEPVESELRGLRVEQADF